MVFVVMKFLGGLCVNLNRILIRHSEFRIPHSELNHTLPFSGGILGFSTLGLMSPDFIRAFFVITGPNSS